MNLHQIYPIEIDLSHENQAAWFFITSTFLSIVLKIHGPFPKNYEFNNFSDETVKY